MADTTGQCIGWHRLTEEQYQEKKKDYEKKNETPQSAKAKGRRLQQQFRELLIEKLDIHPEDIESRSMGAGGEDLIMATRFHKRKVYV